MKYFAMVTVLALGACSERPGHARAENGGTLVIVTTADPGSLFPPLIITSEAKQIGEQIYDYLADVGPDLDVRDEKKFRPGLADRWTWMNDSLMLSFHINPAAKWHDGRDVTARDIAFTFALNKNPAMASRIESDIANIDSVTVTDSLTAVFWFHQRSPTQFLDAAAQMLILPAHQLENLRVSALRENPPPPIGTGRFRLRKWDKGASVELVADTANFRGRARLDRVIWSVAPELQTAVARFVGGEADLFASLRPENLAAVSSKRNLRVIVQPGMDYAFLRFNLRDPQAPDRPHPLFGERELRRAIGMSLNRAAMVRNVFDTFALVPVGPNVRAFASTDPTLRQLPFDSSQATRVLDSLGWRRAGSGIRSRDGRELSFTLIVPTTSLGRMRMAPLIQEQLRRIGVQVRIEPLESSTELDREMRGAFDAALGAWVMPSSPDAIRAAWTTTGIGKSGTNFGAYSDPQFDTLLDSALWAPPVSERAAFARAFRVINEDAPAIWLYEARHLLGVSRRIRTAVLRPDAWWFDLADWYVPAGERISRDRMPFGR
ncbi:MAG TPA: peptide ABC transporter substrate-binding protein [Gemmatimonadaceae bacterium]|nr:peptide ABC transporter substrate-binding protein [Gemmatimonadaceae bacterium]